MAEVLVEYEAPVVHGSDSYQARAVGRPAGHMWEGWLEFIPENGGVVVSGVESTQSEREHLIYWATGLTPIYLEGALVRALKPAATVEMRIPEEPLSDAPAPRVAHRTVVASTPEPVLDPFEIGGRSLDVLRQELTALNRPRLLNIIVAFELNGGGEDLAWMSDLQLVTFVVTAVEAQLAHRTR